MLAGNPCGTLSGGVEGGNAPAQIDREDPFVDRVENNIVVVVFRMMDHVINLAGQPA
jgi:archaellum component FlaC